MEDSAKPIDPSGSGGAVANRPPKPTISPIRERILGPLSRYPRLKNALVSKPILHPVSSIEAELAEMDRAWRKYRSINDRDAVYIYLASVFKVVMRWRLLDCARKKSRRRFALGSTRRNCGPSHSVSLYSVRLIPRLWTPRLGASGLECCGMPLVQSLRVNALPILSNRTAV